MYKKLVLKIFALFLLILISPRMASGTPLPSLEVPDNFNDLVLWIYNIIIFISALAAFAMIVYGGFEYLISAGNPQKMKSGMSKIQSAIIGILIVLIAHLILKTINPDFTKLPDLNP